MRPILRTVEIVQDVIVNLQNRADRGVTTLRFMTDRATNRIDETRSRLDGRRK